MNHYFVVDLMYPGCAFRTEKTAIHELELTNTPSEGSKNLGRSHRLVSKIFLAEI